MKNKSKKRKIQKLDAEKSQALDTLFGENNFQPALSDELEVLRDEAETEVQNEG